MRGKIMAAVLASSLLTVLSPRYAWGGAEVPLTLWQRVQGSDLVVIGTVDAQQPDQSLTRLSKQRVVKGSHAAPNIYLSPKNATYAPGSQMIFFLRSPRVITREAGGQSQVLTTFDAGPSDAVSLAGPDSDKIAEAVQRYASVASISNPKQKNRALVSASMFCIKTNHPMLIEEGAQDLLMVPDLPQYLTGEDHAALSEEVLAVHNGNYYKRDLIDAVGYAHSEKSVRSIVYALTESGSVNIRDTAGRNLASINSEAAQDLLITSLRNPRNQNPESQASLANALGAIKSSEAVPYLIERAKAGNDRDLRVESLLALGKIQDLRALPILNQTLSDPDPVIQRATIQALAWLDRPEAYSVLRTFESSCGNPRVKVHAQMLLKTPKTTIPIY